MSRLTQTAIMKGDLYPIRGTINWGDLKMHHKHFLTTSMQNDQNIYPHLNIKNAGKKQFYNGQIHWKIVLSLDFSQLVKS